MSGDDGTDDLLDHVLADGLQGDLGGVLGGDHHGIHTGGLAVHILHSDLGLAVGTEVVQLAALTDGGQSLGQLVGQGDGQGHELGSLVAGVAEHETLVARAGVESVRLTVLGLQGLVHAHGDIGGLLVDGGDDGAGVAVKAVLGTGVSDLADGLADDLLEVHGSLGGDLTHDGHKAGGAEGLAGHAGHGILAEQLVQDGVGDLVGNLVGMTLGHGFAGEQHFAVVVNHDCMSFRFDYKKVKSDEKRPCRGETAGVFFV